MSKIETLLESFQGKKIVVIGDIMLDKYLEGEVSRISPEAPVPIVKVEKEFYELGGAGNVASNCATLGGSVSLFAFVGKDESSAALKGLLQKKGIAFFWNECSCTTEKTRLIGKSQQLLRYDKEDAKPKYFDDFTKSTLIEKVREADIVIISDYAKGVVTEDLMSLLENYRAKIIVDPRPQNKNLYRGVFLITPNEKEAFEMSSLKDARASGNLLQKELNAHILMTRSEKGMMLFSDKIMEIPTYAKEVYDITGAGDTAIAGVALALAAGASLEESAILANHAAGIAVSKKGTYSVTLKELVDKISFEGSKIVPFDKLKLIVEEQKRKGKKIVWTNGCFDLLHVGHVRYLQEAKRLGDILIVGLNSDDSVRKLKGSGRPLQSEKERAEIIASLGCVDYILIFPESDVTRYLREFKPECYTKGADYSLDTVKSEERAIVESYGGKIVFISLVEGKSVSELLKKLRGGNE